MEQKIKDFLEKGGKITPIPAGESGWDSKKGAIKPGKEIFDKPREERTPLKHVLATVDARRMQNKQPVKKPKPPSKPKEKILYDDFGDPIRRVWVDE